MYTQLVRPPRARVACAFLMLILTFTFLLAACGDVDNNSTSVSITVRPQTVIAGAQQNNNPNSGIPTDPTRSGTLVAGATATPIPPQPTAASQAPTPTPAAANTTAASGATTAAAPAGDAAKGLALFNSNTCGTCHLQGGKAKGIGPALINSPRDDAYIRNQLKNGKGQMPAYPNLTEAQQTDIIAYIRSIK